MDKKYFQKKKKKKEGAQLPGSRITDPTSPGAAAASARAAAIHAPVNWPPCAAQYVALAATDPEGRRREKALTAPRLERTTLALGAPAKIICPEAATAAPKSSNEEPSDGRVCAT